MARRSRAVTAPPLRNAVNNDGRNFMKCARAAANVASLFLSLSVFQDDDDDEDGVFFIKTLLKYQSSAGRAVSRRFDRRAARIILRLIARSSSLISLKFRHAPELWTTCMEHGPPINLQIRILPYGVADVLDPKRVALVVDPGQQRASCHPLEPSSGNTRNSVHETLRASIRRL